MCHYACINVSVNVNVSGCDLIVAFSSVCPNRASLFQYLLPKIRDSNHDETQCVNVKCKWRLVSGQI